MQSDRLLFGFAALALCVVACQAAAPASSKDDDASKEETNSDEDEEESEEESSSSATTTTAPTTTPATDGGAAEGDTITVPVQASKDCITVACPASHPFPVGCAITFEGDDDRGCIAKTPNKSELYLQEGNKCSSGKASGTIICGKTAGTVDQTTCQMNKKTKLFVADKDDCP